MGKGNAFIKVHYHSNPQIIRKDSYMQLKRGAPSNIIYVPYLQILHGIYFLA